VRLVHRTISPPFGSGNRAFGTAFSRRKAGEIFAGHMGNKYIFNAELTCYQQLPKLTKTANPQLL